MGAATTSPSPPAPIDRWRWGVVWLLFLATMLTYLDRQALNQTATYLMAEFQVPENQRETTYKTIENRFAYTYAVFQFVAGFFADRFSMRWLYLAALVVWSAAGFVTGLVPVGALWMLMACRMVLGVGEAFNWPCAIATPLLVLLVVDKTTGEGWRTVFLAAGATGMVWVVLWLVLVRGEIARVVDTPPASGEAAEGGGADLSFWAIFTLRRFWLTMLASWTVNGCWHFFRTWFVRYLGKDLQQDAADIQWLTMGFFVAADIGCTMSGYVVRRLTRAGYSVERSRKLVMAVVAAACLLAIPATQVPGIEVKMALFFVVAAGAMAGFPIYFSMAQDIASRHTARMIGIGGSTSWLLIALTNEQVGPWADEYGTFVPAVIAASVVPVVAATVVWLWPEPRRAVQPV